MIDCKTHEAAVERIQKLESELEQREDWLIESEDEATHAIAWAQAALARCARLEAVLECESADADKWLSVAKSNQSSAVYQRRRAERAEARVAELEADGHVAVMLPREDMEALMDLWDMENYDVSVRLHEACRKALEADDE